MWSHPSKDAWSRSPCFYLCPLVFPTLSLPFCLLPLNCFTKNNTTILQITPQNTFKYIAPSQLQIFYFYLGLGIIVSTNNSTYRSLTFVLQMVIWHIYCSQTKGIPGGMNFNLFLAIFLLPIDNYLDSILSERTPCILSILFSQLNGWANTLPPPINALPLDPSITIHLSGLQETRCYHVRYLLYWSGEN